MEKLDVAVVRYRAKISETITLLVKSEDMQKLNEIKKALVAEKNSQTQENKQEQKQEQKHGKAK